VQHGMLLAADVLKQEKRDSMQQMSIMATP
jgi:hypothetical protein